MIPSELRAWQQAMGYTQKQAAKELVVSWATYKRHLVNGKDEFFS